MSSAVEQGLEESQTNLVDYLLEYLDTGIFRNKNSQTYVRAYSTIHNLVEYKGGGDLLYSYYIQTIENYTRRIAQTNFSESAGTKLLDVLIRSWENHKILIYWMRKIFCHLERQYVKNKQVTPLFQAGLEIFRNIIYAQFKDMVADAMIFEIQRDRDGELCERMGRRRLKLIATFFMQIGLHDVEIGKERDDSGERLLWRGHQNYFFYDNDFESRFLESTRIYYQEKSAEWYSTLSESEYLDTAKRVYAEENDRADQILEPKTKPALLDIVKTEVLTAHGHSLSDLN